MLPDEINEKLAQIANSAKTLMSSILVFRTYKMGSQLKKIVIQ